MMVAITATFVILALLGWIVSMPNRLQRLAEQSIKENNIIPLITELQQRPEELRTRSFDKALTQLWNAQAYTLSAQCLKHLLEHDSRCTKGHKWLKRMLEEQPQVAQQELTPELLKQYNPGLAAQCDAGG